MELVVDLGQKFEILGMKISVFTIIVLIILIFLIYRTCFKNYKNEEKFGAHDDTKINAYNFNTEWCGYSTRFQPEWNEFTNKAEELNINIHDIKCDDNANDEICKKYSDMKIPGHEDGVLTGFPTVIFEVPGKEHPIVYQNERTAEALESYTKEL